MRKRLAEVPGVFWIAIAFTAMAIWSGSLFGIYIAVACVVVGVLQLARQR